MEAMTFHVGLQLGEAVLSSARMLKISQQYRLGVNLNHHIKSLHSSRSVWFPYSETGLQVGKTVDCHQQRHV
jgi:hypothetical protein